MLSTLAILKRSPRALGPATGQSFLAKLNEGPQTLALQGFFNLTMLATLGKMNRA